MERSGLGVICGIIPALLFGMRKCEPVQVPRFESGTSNKFAFFSNQHHNALLLEGSQKACDVRCNREVRLLVGSDNLLLKIRQFAAEVGSEHVC
jgi:hypothetical protein